MLNVENISFSYADHAVICNVKFAVTAGSVVSVIGESGCGKSTLLKLLYGLYDLDEGEISWFGKQVLGPKFRLIPGEEYMKYLAQDFGLMPYITAAENVGKYLSNIDAGKKKARIMELLTVVDMVEFAHIKPQYLSGGQQQRIAIAKALALEPEILLLDEPFSQIDTFRAHTLRRSLFRYFKEKKITCILATHDANDVLSFSDIAIVMKDGKLIAGGSPAEIYKNPSNMYVASLFGEVNELDAKLLDKNEIGEKTIFIRPHQLRTIENSNFEVVVTSNYFRGSHYLVESVYRSQTIFFENDTPIEKGSNACLSLR